MFPPGEEIGPLDGKYIDRYTIIPETRPLRYPELPTIFSGVDSLHSTRIACHEISHFLGMRDLYDYDAKYDTGSVSTPGDDWTGA